MIRRFEVVFFLGVFVNFEYSLEVWNLDFVLVRGYCRGIKKLVEI